eukprot:234689_1
MLHMQMNYWMDLIFIKIHYHFFDFLYTFHSIAIDHNTTIIFCCCNLTFICILFCIFNIIISSISNVDKVCNRLPSPRPFDVFDIDIFVDSSPVPVVNVSCSND